MPRYFRTPQGQPAIILNDSSVYKSLSAGAAWSAGSLPDLNEEMSYGQWVHAFQDWPIPVRAGVYDRVFAGETMQEAQWWNGPKLPPGPASRPSPSPSTVTWGPADLPFWILRGGIWHDTGLWYDDAVWIDA